MRLTPVYILFLASVLLFSCGEKIEEFDGYLKSEAERLLMNTGYDSAKVWLLTDYEINGESAMTNCLDSVRVQFVRVNIDSLELEGDYVFYYNNPSQCTVNNLCTDISDVCDLNGEFCEEYPDFCNSINPNIIFAGSWSIPEPEVENGKVRTLIIDGPDGEVTYDLRYFTSENLDILSTAVDNDQNVEIRKRLKYEQ